MSRGLRRRDLLTAGLGSVLWSLAGCNGPTTFSADETTESDEETTPWGRIHPIELLPRGDGGWDQRHRDHLDYELIGGEEGAQAAYRSDDGLNAEVVVVRPMENDAVTATARRFACAGWQVTVPYREFAFAATTRAERTRTQTETTTRGTRARLERVGPTVAGSRPALVRLLSTCPGLTEERVDRLALSCDDG